MDNPDIQTALRDLRLRVDVLTDSFIVLQSLLVLQATDPEGLRMFETEELMELLADQTKTVRQKREVIDAVRRRRPPPTTPPHAAN